ncbi:MAG: polysaccharide biosynthesis protein, partial [Clostridium sp.]
ILFYTVVPVILSSAIYNLNSVLDNGILAYNFKTLGQGDEFASIWGVYTGKYHLLINVPMAISNALSSSLIPSVSRAVAMGDKKLVKSAWHPRSGSPVSLRSRLRWTHGACGPNNLVLRDNSLAIRMTIYGSGGGIIVSTVQTRSFRASIKMRLIFHAVISLVLHLIALDHGLGSTGIYSMVFSISCSRSSWS